MIMKDLRSMTFDELQREMEALGEKKFRASQIYDWFHVKLADSWEEMSNLPKELKSRLSEEYPIQGVTEVKRLVSQIDASAKFLLRLYDGNVIESVLMRYHYGNSVCISSQVGCRMGCSFCASGLLGLERNMTASEMLSEVYHIQKASGERVSHVVVMGTGEPFDNYDELIHFIRILTSEKGLHISQRDVTVSTCGIVPKIREFADEGLACTLAVSLHAPNDDLRRKLMPIARKYSIEEILDAVDYFTSKTGRRATIEYSLVRGENDSDECAMELSSRLAGRLVHVNLIPVNPIRERSYVSSEARAVQHFQKVLEKNHINVTIRREIGRDISAACGQLRREYYQGGSR